MKANLNYPPFQIVTWYSPEVPDYAGTLSGYAFNLLLNIAVDGQPTNLVGPVQYNLPEGPASGDLASCYPNPIVIGINDIPLNLSENPENGQVLTYNSSDGYIEWQTPGTGSLNAGGDLSGTYPNPHVISVAHVTTGVLPAANQAAQTLTGDVTGNTGANVVNKIHGASVPIAGSLTVGNVLQVSGLSSLVYAPSAALTNTVSTLTSLIPTLSNQSAFVDGYVAHNDAGFSGNGTFIWNPTYTGPATPLNVYPTGYTTGAWQRQIGPDFLINVTWFGAKGDGVTDDTAAIQACINACSLYGYGIYFPALTSASGLTTYLTSKPLFLGGTNATQKGLEVRMGQGVSVTVSSQVSAPAMVSGLQLPNPTYGPESGLTYLSMISPGGEGWYYYNLSMLPNASSVTNWGDGNVAQLAQSFTQPAQLTSVTNIQVSSTAAYPSFSTVYISGGGIYYMTVVDGTHVNLEWLGGAVAIDVAQGGTVANGAGISINGYQIARGPSAGFTFECFVDPITNFANGTALYLIASQGCFGTKFPLTCAFYVSLYNDQSAAQTRLKFSLTTTTGTHVINSSTHTITAGSMVHIAATYDGISTMSLYIAGTRVATATVTGPIVQSWYEQVCIGGLNINSYPNVGFALPQPQTINIAGIGLHAIAKYSGASFTAPTTVPTPIGRVASTVIDFAQTTTVIGPGGLNFAQGWVLAQTPTSNSGTMTTWLPSKASLNDNEINYCVGPRMTNCTLVSANGIACLLTNAALYGLLENCTFTCGIAGVTLAGFSYSWRIQNCTVNGGAANYGLSWCYGILDGSQFIVIDGGAAFACAWNIVTNVDAGIIIKNLYLESTTCGSILLGPTNQGIGAPSASIRDCFVQSDLGNSGGNPVSDTIYAYNVAGLVVEGGYAAGDLAGTPQVIVDSCGNVSINCLWFSPEAGGPCMQIYNQQFPVLVNAQQYPSAPYTPYAMGLANMHVTNGSASVVVSNLLYQYNIVATMYIQFASQPSTTYRIASVVTGVSTQTYTLHTAYSGTTNSATIGTIVGTSWMPEDGYSGQGPLYISQQETFGSNTVNIISSSGMTLLVNDFLFGKIIFVDLNSLLSGGVTVVTPNIVGYQRTFINNTSQTLTISAGAGTTVNVASGSFGRMLLLSTGWVSD